MRGTRGERPVGLRLVWLSAGWVAVRPPHQVVGVTFRLRLCCTHMTVTVGDSGEDRAASATSRIGKQEATKNIMRFAPISIMGAGLLFIVLISSRAEPKRERVAPVASARSLSMVEPEQVSLVRPLMSPPPPPADASAAWLQAPPTPVPALRRAAGTYFPQMTDTKSDVALPDRFDGTTNPCWNTKYCLPGFLILGVYQSGVRDLYSRLQQHPGIAQRAANSPSFYSQVRPNWVEYVHGLESAAPQALSGKLLGEASAVTYHFVWVHQEKFNQPYVESMGKFWRDCNARTAQEKAALPHRLCMAARMADGRESDAALARSAGLPFVPDAGLVAQERAFSVPQLVRAVYGDFSPALIVLLRKPWRRMHSSFYNCKSALLPTDPTCTLRRPLLVLTDC